MGKIVLTPETLSSSPTPGMLEFDGTVPRFSLTNNNRALFPGMMMFSPTSAIVGTATTNEQTLFGVGCVVESNTTYVLNMLLFLSKTVTATAHTISLGFASGSATFSNMWYMSTGINESGTFPIVETTPNLAAVNTPNLTAVTVSFGATNQIHSMNIAGEFTIDQGGTFIPTYRTSVSTGPYSLQPGSFISIYPVGVAGSNVNVGGWS